MTQLVHGPRILVVDEDPLFRELLVLALEEHGYRAETSEHIQDAMTRVGKTTFDMAVVDRFLGHAGRRSARELLQEASSLPLPVISLCAADPAANPTTKSDAGVVDRTGGPASAKDFDLTPLVTYVNWLFGRIDGDAPSVSQQDEWIAFAPRPPSRLYFALKRTLDVVAAGIALILLAPLFLAIAAAIKLTSPGPLFFRQTRVGLRGKPFACYKFRTMVQDAEALKKALAARNEHGSRGVTFKMKRDPRVTAVGYWLRRFSLDELPQLFHVLGGTMTLVGPRPPVPQEVERYTLLDRHRLAVKPGLTCLWQVGGRADLDFIGQVNLDLAYIHNRSLREDLIILLRTVPAVVSGRGAY
jgi:lipopolysaccharide/colanic/teichoic acid biosynthesis glycosyltransferase